MSLLSVSLLGLNGCDVSSGTSTANTDVDTIVIDFPVAYVDRTLPRDDNGALLEENILEPDAFNAGARLMLKSRSSVASVAIDIMGEFFPPNEDGSPALYDVKDLSASADGSRLLFALRAPEIPDADDDEQPTWNIWEYNIAEDNFRRIIISDIAAEAGQDISPQYLPNDDIIFTSTRQRRGGAILLDEGKSQFAATIEGDRDTETFNLHKIDNAGNDIDQLSFNQSHDLTPSLRANGKIIFLRWDKYSNARNIDNLSLYQMNQDGSQLEHLYGYHSQETGTDNSEAIFFKPRELDDGRIAVSLKQRENAHYGGGIVAIDVDNYTDSEQTVNEPIGAVQAQEVLTNGSVSTLGNINTYSPQGIFSSVYPLFDDTDRLLVSWSPCSIEGYGLNLYTTNNASLVDANGNTTGNANDFTDEELGVYPCPIPLNESLNFNFAEPLYGLWIYDTRSNTLNNTQSPVVISEIGRMITDAIVLEPRIPPSITTFTPNSDFDLDGQVGAVNIKSVYDFDGIDLSPEGIAVTGNPLQTAADARLARFIRISKAVSIPTEDVRDFNLNMALGDSNRLGMKEIIGYVPIEPDGSAFFKVPSDIAFTFDILDEKGQRITEGGPDGDIEFQRHRNWMTVKRGEILQCIGCHTNDSTLPHGRINAQATPVNMGALLMQSFLDTAPINGQPPISGETMAEYYARLIGIRDPSVNLSFTEVWVDDSSANIPATSYANDTLGLAPIVNVIPQNCIDQWSALCRVVINYEQHIQPIWDKARDIDINNDTLLDNATCSTCHSRNNIDSAGLLIPPAGENQIDLSTMLLVQPNQRFTSYTELFDGGVEEIVNDDGVLAPLLRQIVDAGELLFLAERRDEEGNLLESNIPTTLDPNALVPTSIDPELILSLDDEGNLIPATQTINLDSVMDTDGAQASSDFFTVFDNPSPAATINHQLMLSPSELKILREWVDNGGQYYNNPFDAPEDN